jgi:23S rRNA (adenine-N6)-dimethyltransferase
MLKDSQNFIKDGGLVLKLLEMVHIPSDSCVIEIGPGKGIITDKLVARYREVITIEADVRFYQTLKVRYENTPNVHLVCGDFLKYQLPDKAFNVISNIPFNITADIVKKITAIGSHLESAYLIMQRSAAEKFAGGYGQGTPLLSNFLQVDYEIKILTTIKRDAFVPRPKYDAVFVLFQKRKKSILEGKESLWFKDFLSYLFDRSKPSLGESLTTLLSKRQTAILLENLSLNEDLMIKQVKFLEWVDIYSSTRAIPGMNIERVVSGSYSKLISQQSRIQKIHRTRRY